MIQISTTTAIGRLKEIQRLTDLSAGVFALKFFAAISAFVALTLILTASYADYRVLIFGLLEACSVCLVVATRNNVILFVISFIIAYANYSAGLANTFPPYSGYDTVYANMPVSALGLSLTLLFTAALLLFIPAEINTVRDVRVFDRWKLEKYSGVLVFAIAAVLIVVFFTCSSGFTVGDSGRASNNSIFEYSYILFIFGFMIAGENRKLRLLMTSVAILYLSQVFWGSNRASGLAFALLLFVAFFAGKTTWIKLLPLLLLGFLAMMSMGYFRYGDDFFLFKLFDAVLKLGETGGVWDTASYAFHQSIAFLRLDEAIGPDDKSHFVMQWLLSCFIGTSSVPDSNLSIYCQSIYPGMGGGFLPLYAYFYLGLPGVFVASAYIAWLFKKISTLGHIESDLMFCVALSASVTCCRWYLYSPSPLTTGIVFLTIAYIFVRLFILKVPPGTREGNRDAGHS